MDLLQRELARKKALLSKAFEGSDSNASKYQSKRQKKIYRKQSEIRAQEEAQEEREELERQQQRQQTKPKEQQEQQQQEQEESDASKQKASKLEDTSNTLSSQEQHPHKSKLSKRPAAAVKQSNCSSKRQRGNVLDATKASDQTQETVASQDGEVPDEATLIKQLRTLGLVVKFFGESLKERQHRLEKAIKAQDQTLQGLSEMQEFRLGQGHGIRNPFLQKDDLPSSTALSRDRRGETDKAGDMEKEEEDDDDHDEDPPKRIYKFLKGLLKEWERDLEARSDTVARSVAGRNESKTLKQCKDYIRPLFKLLKQRKLEPGMQAHLTKIVECAIAGEFVKAHDAYIDVAIGRAAWPIGVTMVGIHARSGRAKIESSNVAHVMNSELQRKYLTSVKRLLTYAQKKRPDVDPSKKVG